MANMDNGHRKKTPIFITFGRLPSYTFIANRLERVASFGRIERFVQENKFIFMFYENIICSAFRQSTFKPKLR